MLAEQAVTAEFIGLFREPVENPSLAFFPTLQGRCISQKINNRTAILSTGCMTKTQQASGQFATWRALLKNRNVRWLWMVIGRLMVT